MEHMKEVCQFCGGSGQISFFKGVSRFLLSWEECPECAGLGYLNAAEADNGTSPPSGGKRGRRAGKGNKKTR